MTSRKFLLTAGAYIVNTALLVFGKIDASAFVTLSTLMLGGYLAANVTQKATAK